MPRRPKPKNSLSAGERAAKYEAEKRERFAYVDDPPSVKNIDEESGGKEMPVSVNTESIAETAIVSTAKESKEKALPKPQKAVVKVDFSIPVGRVKPMHGMCNGPVSYGSDITWMFKEIGVPAVRFDGTDTPMSGYAVDISRIFKNADADPYDESSYDFAVTDRYVEAARLAGAEIVFRLGESRDPLSPEREVPLPRDLDILARVCVNVVRHYNDRFSSGYSMGITRFEIWSRSLSNDKKKVAEDFEIYRRIANAVKLHDESLLVGGMSFGSSVEIGEFLRYCKRNRAPVDFITIDSFERDPRATVAELESAVRVACNLGFSQLDVLVGKWAYCADGKGLKEAVRKRGTLEDAAYSGALMLALEETEGASGAFAYDAQPMVSPWCGIASREGNTQKPYYAFKAFGELYRAGERVLCQCEQSEGFAHNGIYSSAAVAEDGRCYLMIASFDGCGTVDVRMDGIPDNVYEAEIFMLDGVKNMESAGSVTVSGSKKRLVLNVSGYGVFLIKLF